MKLRYKLILGFLLSALLVAVVGYVSHSLNRDIRDRLVEINARSIYLMEYTGEMAMALHQSLMYTREYIDELYRLNSADGISDTQREEIKFSVRETREQVQSQLDRFEKYMTRSLEMARRMDSSRAVQREAPTAGDTSLIGRLKTFRSKFRMYESLLLEMFKFSKDGYQDGQELLTVTLEPFFKSSLMPLIDRMRTLAHRRLDRETTRLEQQLDFALQTILLVGLIAVFSAIGLGVAIYRQISDPLNKLTESARKIGEGNLDERIEISSDDEIGTLARTFNRMVENLDKTTVSRNYFNNIIESLSDGLLVVNDDYEVLKVNQTLLQLTGYKREDLSNADIVSLFEPEEQDRIVSQIRKASDDDIEYIETVICTQHGESVEVSFSASPLTARHEQNSYVCLISDIRERKEAERQIEQSLEEKKVLLAEIHHRVKNNLAVISSLLQMQLHNTENETVYNLLQDSVLRIQSIALIHEKLYQSDTLAFIDYGTYIKDLVNTIEDSFSSSAQDITIQQDFSPVSLNINQAIPCSLFINEVIVNSFKHAFDEEGMGNIHVKLKEVDEEVHVKIQDDGRGLPEDFDIDDAKSLGMTLIHTLTKQLSGELSIYNDNGAVYALTFPLE